MRDMNTLIENIRTAPDSEIARILETTSDAEFARLSAKEAVKICDLVLSAVDPRMATRILAKFQTPVLKAMLLECSPESLTHFLSVIQTSQLKKILASADNQLVLKLIRQLLPEVFGLVSQKPFQSSDENIGLTL